MDVAKRVVKVVVIKKLWMIETFGSKMKRKLKKNWIESFFSFFDGTDWHWLMFTVVVGKRVINNFFYSKELKLTPGS